MEADRLKMFMCFVSLQATGIWFRVWRYQASSSSTRAYGILMGSSEHWPNCPATTRFCFITLTILTHVCIFCHCRRRGFDSRSSEDGIAPPVPPRTASSRGRVNTKLPGKMHASKSSGCISSFTGNTRTGGKEAPIKGPIWAAYNYRKFSNRGATPYRGAPSFLAPGLLGFWTFLPISQPKKVRFSISKKPREGEIALSLMRAPPKGFPTRPVPLLGNLRYFSKVYRGMDSSSILC